MSGKQEEAETSTANTNPPTESKKSVQFDVPSDEERKREAARRRKILNEQARAQRRFKIGSSKGNPYRDVATFVFVVGCLFYMALKSEFEEASKNKEETSPSSNNKIPMADMLNNAMEALGTKMMEDTEKVRRKDPCSLFVARSTIPNTVQAQGLFAGQDYQPGDVIQTSDSWWVPMMEDTESEEFLSVSSLALLAKFHPALANIDGLIVKENHKAAGDHDDDDDEYAAFVATRPIEAGDELFLPPEKHPAQLLTDINPALVTVFQNTIPSSQDYALADEITAKIMNVGTQMSTAHARKQQNAVRQLETSYLYSLGRAVASKFDPKFNSLLPSNRAEYNKRDMSKVSSQWAALNNLTFSAIQIMGSCLSDVSLTPTTSTTSLRRLEKDDVVTVLPLYAVTDPSSSASCVADNEQQQCTKGDSSGWWPRASRYCVSALESTKVAFCSLSFFPIQDLLARSGSSAEELVPNIEVRWKTPPKIDQVTLTGLQQELLPGSLAWQVVALTTIEVGDKLVLSQSTALADELIPRAWREA